MVGRFFSYVGLGFGLSLAAGVLEAAPQETSCAFLEAIGNNKPEAIEPLIADVATIWLPESRDAAAQSLTQVAREIPFSGGTVYRVTDLGEDLVEHLLIVRLKAGDVHGMLLRYTWSPDGLKLTGLDYKQKVEDLNFLALRGPAEPLNCGG